MHVAKEVRRSVVKGSDVRTIFLFFQSNIFVIISEKLCQHLHDSSVRCHIRIPQPHQISYTIEQNSKIQSLTVYHQVAVFQEHYTYSSNKSSRALRLFLSLLNLIFQEHYAYSSHNFIWSKTCFVFTMKIPLCLFLLN